MKIINCQKNTIFSIINLIKMKKLQLIKWISTAVLVSFFALLLNSCRDDESTDVKFEITGNFTGELEAVVSVSSENSSEGGSNQVKTLPWSKEYTSAVGRTELGISTSSTKAGASGQTITISIYRGGKQVERLVATTNADGHIEMKTLTHVG